MGPAALKLEGRTKSGGYVAQVADVYRTAIDTVCSPSSSLHKETKARLLHELLHTSSRPLCSGFYLSERYVESVPQDFVARPVVARVMRRHENGGWEVQVRSPWDDSAEASVLLPGMRRPMLKAGGYTLENHRGERTERLNPGMQGVLHCEAEGIMPGIYIRA